MTVSVSSTQTLLGYPTGFIMSFDSDELRALSYAGASGAVSMANMSTTKQNIIINSTADSSSVRGYARNPASLSGASFGLSSTPTFRGSTICAIYDDDNPPPFGTGLSYCTVEIAGWVAFDYFKAIRVNGQYFHAAKSLAQQAIASGGALRTLWSWSQFAVQRGQFGLVANANTTLEFFY